MYDVRKNSNRCRLRIGVVSLSRSWARRCSSWWATCRGSPHPLVVESASGQNGMSGPLEGLRILDLSQIVSGPFASLLLSDQGAEVVKVEPVDGQDVTRRQNFARGGLSAFYMNGNRGKRSVSIDLTVDDGRQILLDLASTADGFIQNFRPGAMHRGGCTRGDALENFGLPRISKIP